MRSESVDSGVWLLEMCHGAPGLDLGYFQYGVLLRHFRALRPRSEVLDSLISMKH